ncbi:MAG: D-tyrosyl-tRNA(Tyr) deacylase [Oscillospiraceae bacterium]|jgi:D-tyrosyl-tRNA(Tyr) deacylase|nr:D-tyrosyl-tRNA(Tyr) deacylase [Oscillospiraceae bacterium]
MRAVVTRVSEASVSVGAERCAAIGQGFLILLGVGRDDTEDDARRLADRVCRLRVFADADGKMNVAPAEAGAALLVVSNFTLFGDCFASRRPGFTGAARPERAEPLYQCFTSACRAAGLPVQTGVFGAHMAVHSVNDGPVTLFLDTSRVEEPSARQLR